VDQVLDEAERAISEGVRELACRLNRGATSFQQTAENLARAAHLNVSKETLRKLIEEEGRAVLKAQQRGELAPDWEAKDCRTDNGKTRVYLGCDGRGTRLRAGRVPLVTDTEKQKRRAKVKAKRRKKGRRCRPLPPRKEGADQAYKEFKLGVLYDEEQKRRYVGATSGDHAVCGRRAPPRSGGRQRMATQIGLPKAEEKIGNVDGSPWIRNEIDLYGLVDALGLDYYHLRENVQKARLVVYGAENAEGQAWREKVMGLFHERGYDAAGEHLVAWRSTLQGSKREAAERLLGYVAERREMIRYPEFRSRGWQIGSGPTEAQCKASTQRLKGRGRRWDRANAEAIMALDCQGSSHSWHLHWENLEPTTN
jgi:hypothetical protein